MVKLAVLAGCNYPNMGDDELEGGHRDVLVMQEVLVQYLGFHKNSIEVLVDKPGSKKKPTGADIKEALSRMISRARSGDVLFFHFSGYGTYFRHSNGVFEAILPCDYNCLTALDFRQLVDRVPEGATFTILADSCCNTGGLIDKETEQIGPQHPPHNGSPPVCTSGARLPRRKRRMVPSEAVLQKLASMTGLDSPDIAVHQLALFGPDASILFRLLPNHHPKPLKPGQGMLLSACQPNELADEGGAGEDPFSIFTDALVNQIIMMGPSPCGPLTNREVVINARKVFNWHYLNHQHPCLYCNNMNADAVFLG